MLLPVLMGIGYGYALSRHVPAPRGVGLSNPHRAALAGVSPTLGEMSLEEAEAFLQSGLMGVNLHQLSKGIQGISQALHNGVIRYNRMDRRERWLSIREIWALKYDDCEDCEDLVL